MLNYHYSINTSKIIYLISGIFLKIALEYSYTNFVSPYYQHSFFYFDLTLIKYLEGWILFIVLLYLSPYILKKPSDFIINILLFNFICPLIVFYSLSNAPREHLYLVLTSIIIIFIFRSEKKIKIPQIVSGDSIAYFLSFLSIFIVTLWLIKSGALKYFNLNLLAVYDLRSYTDQLINLNIFGYLNTWTFKVFAPFLMVVCLQKKKYFYLFLIFILYLFWFGINNYKALIFYPFIILFIFVFFKKNKNLYIIPITYLLIILISYFVYIIDDNILYGSILIRRAFFVSSLLTFTYYDFFSQTEFVYWSNSIASYFMSYPFDLNPPRLIGEYLQIDSHANNSFLSTGYMHAGIWGLIFYSILFSLILKIIDSSLYSAKNNWMILAIIIIPMLSLVLTADLFTALLTHGVLISIILLYLFRINFQKK